ncbi:MAG: ABC transporter permease subunit [Planctomycetota bacterium]|nr:ABC transporter permease subunit [Planctomycetota bacterium]
MKLFAIARNAFIEAIRQPVYGVLILVTFTVLVLDLPLSTYTMGEGIAEYQKTDQQMLVNLGLSTLLISGLLIAVFSASGVLSREIEDKTILTVVSKPVPRPMVVLGKFVGVAAAILVSFWLCSLVFLMTVRHKVMPTASDPYDLPVIVLGCSAFVATIVAALFCNYFFGWNFASAAVGFGVILLSLAMGAIAFVGKQWKIVPFGEDISPDLLMALGLMLFAVLVFVAVAVAASTRLGQVMTLLVCFSFFFLGSTSHYFFGRVADESSAAKIAYLLFPNLTFFYVMNALMADRPIPVGYVGLAIAYAACHIAAILAIGMALFQRRELTAQDGSGSSSAPLPVSILAWTGRAGALGAGMLALTVSNGFGSINAIVFTVALGAAAVVGWVFCGWFGRGVKWTWYFVLVCAVLTIILVIAIGFGLWAGFSTPVLYSVAAAAGGVVLILLLPRTRYHFEILRKTF